MIRRTLLLTTFALLALASAASAHGPKVIASGLDNPRGIDLDPSTGALYVAEAGRGGPGPCIPGGEGEACLGPTGAITRIAHGHQREVVRGLPSVAGEGGAGASGPQDVDVKLLGFGSFVTGLGADPALRDELGTAGAGLASLFHFTPFGRAYKRADLGAYEAAADPDKNEPGTEGPNTNPTSVLNERRGHVAVDAGGNTLLRVGLGGQVSTIAVFPNRFINAPPLPPGVDFPMQPVPTAVAKGPDGAYYVSQLTGFPFPVGGASIFRVVPGHEPQVYASGLTNVTDLAFGRDGSLYVVQISKIGLANEPETEPDSSGNVIRIPRKGNRRVIADLPTPYGIALGRRGEIYVTIHSASAGAGEVVRLG